MKRLQMLRNTLQATCKNYMKEKNTTTDGTQREKYCSREKYTKYIYIQRDTHKDKDKISSNLLQNTLMVQ